jgi:hypothetical protein
MQRTIISLLSVVRKKNIIMPRIEEKTNFSKIQKPFKVYYKMKGVFWNSRGLADLAKHRFFG